MADDKSNMKLLTDTQAATSAPWRPIKFREWWALDEARPRSRTRIDPVKQALRQMDILTRKVARSSDSRVRDRNLAQQHRVLAMLAVRLAGSSQRARLRRAR